MDSYKVSVLMTPQYHINNKKPFIWSVLAYSAKDNKWTGIYSGWSESPEKAFIEAKQYYDQLLSIN